MDQYHIRMPGRAPPPAVLKAVHWWRQHEQKKSALLQKLPLELLRKVVDYLPMELKGLLSLSCKAFYSNFAKDAFAQLLDAGNRNNRKQTLTLLERDLPDHILCYYCEGLHAIENTKSLVSLSMSMDIYGYPEWRNPCSRRCLSCKREQHEFLSFPSTVFQMIMKRYRQKQEYRSLRDLLSFNYPATHFGSLMAFGLDPHGPFQMQSTGLARIINGNFLFRKVWKFRFEGYHPFDHNTLAFCRICPHVEYAFEEGFWESANSRECLWKSGCMKCIFCHTEFWTTEQRKKIEKGEDSVFVVRIWRDYGKGKEKNEEKWTRNSEVTTFRNRQKMRRVDCETGNIRIMFEEKENVEAELDYWAGFR